MAVTPNTCEMCAAPLPIPATDGTPTKHFGIYANDQYRTVCESCFLRYYRTYEITTYCANCGANAIAFYRIDWLDIVIGCFACNRRLQRIEMRDYQQLSEEQRERIQQLVFDYWEGR